MFPDQFFIPPCSIFYHNFILIHTLKHYLKPEKWEPLLLKKERWVITKVFDTQNHP